MASGKNPSKLKEQRERALSEHDQRAEEICQWVQKHGGTSHRVNRYATNVNAKTIAALINVIEKELEANQHPDAAILLHIFSYLQTYDFSHTDEAGRDTQGFSLAISELDVALRHLKVNPKNALRYLVYRYKFKTYANNVSGSFYVFFLFLNTQRF